MGKETEELVEDSTPPTMEDIAKNVIQHACAQRGKLKMKVKQRGGKPVDECLEFSLRDLEEVKMRADCSLSLQFSGCRYWLSTKNENHIVLRHIMHHATTGKKIFAFPEGISFCGTRPEATAAQVSQSALETN